MNERGKQMKVFVGQANGWHLGLKGGSATDRRIQRYCAERETVDVVGWRRVWDVEGLS